MEMSRSVEQPSDTKIRRRPSQVRSRQRFEAVLDAAARLIAERGLEPITMTDIAEAADMAVTAVYRYFPSKRSIVRELAQRIIEADAELTVAFSHGEHSSPHAWIVHDMREYCRRHLHDAGRLQIRAAIHADAELAALDLADSRRNAAIIASSLEQAGVSVPRPELERRALVVIEIVDALIRLAARVDADEAEALITEFAETSASSLLRPV